MSVMKEDGSLETLRKLKEAESTSEALLKRTEAEAASELAEAKRLLDQHLVEASATAKRERGERLEAALARSRQTAETINSEAKNNTAKVTPLTDHDIEVLFPEVKDVLFQAITKTKKGKP